MEKFQSIEEVLIKNGRMETAEEYSGVCKEHLERGRNNNKK